MEITVAAEHEENVRPEVGRLHAQARAEAHSKEDVLRRVTEVVGEFSAELKRLQALDPAPVTDIVVRPITTSSWRPSNRGKLLPPQYTASARVRADFVDFGALADLAAQFGALEGLDLLHVEWRLTDASRRRIEAECVTRAVEAARDRALVMARAAGESAVLFVELADPGLLGERRATAEMAYAAEPMMGRGLGSLDGADLQGIEIQPEDITITGCVQARFVTP